MNSRRLDELANRLINSGPRLVCGSGQGVMIGTGILAAAIVALAYWL